VLCGLRKAIAPFVVPQAGFAGSHSIHATFTLLSVPRLAPLTLLSRAHIVEK
jgi:hypothetical protein